MKHIFVIFAFLFVAVHCQSEDGEAGDLYSYDEAEFETKVAEGPHFIMFYAPWCGHCKSLKPVWGELAQYYNVENKNIMKIAKVDCTDQTQICSDNEVRGYPTLKLFRPGKDAVRFSGGRDLESLKDFVKEQLEAKEKPEAEEDDGLYELTSANFKTHISTGNHFVKFFAPWCGHCKRLEPTWKELADKYEDSKLVKIGRVDCTKNQDPCKDSDVKGYPTLVWFKDGKKVDEYRGKRELSDLVDFVEKMAAQKQEVQAKEENQEEEQEKEQVQAKPEVTEGLYDLSKDSFDGAIATGDSFVKFFAPWCGHCRAMEPAWKDLAKAYENDEGVKIARVDCTQHSDVCKSQSVRGYPTLKYFRNGAVVEGSPSGRDLESLKAFVTKMSGKQEETEQVQEQIQEKKEEEPKPEEDGAMALTEDTFKNTIESGVTFVKFYAPWCGHCKRLAPTWDELAREDFSDAEQTIRIAKVDCTEYKWVCMEYEVRGYPTLKLFKDGKEIVKYSGARTLEALKAFVMENSVTPQDQEQKKDEL